MTWIQTYTGKAFDLLADSTHVADVCLDDIAHALSNTCRFNGHVREFYSVAEHSVHVASLVPEEFRRAALLHDAAEAYCGDVVSPLKIALRGDANEQPSTYDQVYKRVETRVALRFGLRPTDLRSDVVNQADLMMLALERDRFFPIRKREWVDLPKPPKPSQVVIGCYRPDKARAVFLRAWAELDSVTLASMVHVP